MSGRVAAIFVAVAVLWGVPYALIEIALEHGAEPLLIAWIRVAISASALTIAAVLLAPGAAASLPTHATTAAWAALASLGILCTAAAFALYYQLITEVGATRAALSVYLAPVISVLTGALAFGEALTADALAGLLLILTGSWLAR